MEEEEEEEERGEEYNSWSTLSVGRKLHDQQPESLSILHDGELHSFTLAVNQRGKYKVEWRGWGVHKKKNAAVYLKQNQFRF